MAEAAAPRSQHNIQIQKTAERDQHKASPPTQHKEGYQQQQQHEQLRQRQQQKQQRKQQQLEQQFYGKKRSVLKKAKFGREPGPYRILCALFGFFQGLFAVIPTTFILSFFNTMIAAIFLPRTALRVGTAIWNSELISDKARMIMLICLPFFSFAWPLVALCNSIFAGMVLGLIGPIFHVLGGSHILLGGVFQVLGQAIGIVRHFYILHRLSSEEIMTLLHIAVNILSDLKNLLVQFWNSDSDDKIETIKQSPPIQGLLRMYDWVLSATFPEQ